MLCSEVVLLALFVLSSTLEQITYEMEREKYDIPEQQDMEETCGNDGEAIGNVREELEPKSPDYPAGLRLVFIFVALCLTVFLVALVGISLLTISPLSGAIWFH